MALTLTDISYAYGSGTVLETRALSGVSVSVEVGEMMLVLGPTGSGKSTLLRLAAGLLRPDRGDVRIDGRPVAGGATAREGGVGLVFQSPETQLFADTVLDDVAFGPRNQGLAEESARAQARAALLAVGLDPDRFGHRSPFTLSGGEARRAALGGVLAMRPRYLLLDEPAAGLDAHGRADLMAALGRTREHAGLLVVVHDAEEFLGMADRVLLLSGGVATHQGMAADLIQRPSPLVEAGLRLPPVLETLERARAAGVRIPRLTLEPERAAELLAGEREVSP